MDSSRRFIFSTLFISLIIPMSFSLLMERTLAYFFSLPLSGASFIFLIVILFLENLTLELYYLKRRPLSWRTFFLEGLILFTAIILLIIFLWRLFPATEGAFTFIQGAFYAFILPLQILFGRLLFFRLRIGYEFSETFDYKKDKESGVHLQVASSYSAARTLLFSFFLFLCFVSMLIVQWNDTLPPFFLAGSFLFLLLVLFSRYLIKNNERNVYWLLRGQELPPVKITPLFILLGLFLVLFIVAIIGSFIIPTLNMEGFKLLLKKFFLWVGEHIEKKDVVIKESEIPDQEMQFISPNRNLVDNEASPLWAILIYILIAIPVLGIAGLIFWPVLKMLNRRNSKSFVKESIGGWRLFWSQLLLFFKDVFRRKESGTMEYKISRRKLLKRRRKKRAEDYHPGEDFRGFYRLIVWGERQGVPFTFDMAPAEYTEHLSTSFPGLEEDFRQLGESFDLLYYSRKSERKELLDKIDYHVNKIVTHGGKK